MNEDVASDVGRAVKLSEEKVFNNHYYFT